MLKMRVSVAVVTVLLLVISSASVRAAPPSKKWQRTIDWDAIEHELEDGDDPELLVTEDELLIADMDRRRAAQPEPPAGVVLRRV